MLIRIYSKPDCHLCDEAKSILLSFAKEYSALEIREIDIEKDPEAFELYQYEIPVIFLEDRKLFKHRIDPDQFRKAVERRL